MNLMSKHFEDYLGLSTDGSKEGETKHMASRKAKERRQEKLLYFGDGGEERNNFWLITAVNINGLNTSWSEFNDLVFETKPTLVAVSETMVRGERLKEKFKIKGYKWITMDYYSRGFAFLIKENLGYSIVSEAKDSEVMLLKVTGEGRYEGKHIYIGGGYCSPNGGKKPMRVLNDWIQALPPSEVFILGGDFNARTTDWCTCDNTNGRILRRLLPLWGATVIAKGPSCVRQNGYSTVDFFITNEPDLILENKIGLDVNSDHRPVSIQVDINSTKVPDKEVLVWDYNHADWDGFRHDVENSLDWPALLKMEEDYYIKRWRFNSGDDILQLVGKLFRNVQSSGSRRVPSRLLQIPSMAKPYWWNNKLENLLRVKQRVSNLINARSGRARRKALGRYKRINRKFRKLEQSRRTSTWRSFCDNLQDPKQLYSIFRRTQGGNSIPSFEGPGGTHCCTDVEKANGFNKAYSSVGNRLVPRIPFHASVEESIRRRKIRWISRGWGRVPKLFTKFTLMAHIKGLKKGTAPGPDGITNEMIRELSTATVDYLARCFQLMYAAGLCPKDWRIANLFPIPKGLEVLKATDLRPIALTAALGKLFERVLNDALEKEVTRLGIIPKSQYGFVRGRETIGITARIAQKLRTMKRNQIRLGVFLDVKKAYNSVWHQGLLFKMSNYGISTHMVRWLSSWLEDREYVTRIGNTLSAPEKHRTGLPQGSVLSPLLFIVYFSDIISDLKSDAFLFADDASLLSKPFRNGEGAAREEIQTDLDKIAEWGLRWQLQFEPRKSKLIIFTRDKTVDRSSFRLTLQGSHIQCYKEARCLGVIFDQEYTFSAEAKKRIHTFEKKIKLVNRIGGYKWGCPPKYMVLLYSSVALASLTYCPWSLLLAPKNFMVKASSMQRQFLRRIFSLPKCSGGDAVEVYAKVLPIAIRLMQLSAGTAVRLNSGGDALFKEEYEEFLQIANLAKEKERIRATNKSPFGLMMSLLHIFQCPIRSKGKAKVSGVAPMAKYMLHNPELPHLRKNESSSAALKAREFAFHVIHKLDADIAKIYIDGHKDEDSCGASMHVVLPDMTSFSEATKIHGELRCC